jgi:hypothetical protein
MYLISMCIAACMFPNIEEHLTTPERKIGGRVVLVVSVLLAPIYIPTRILVFFGVLK